MICPFQQVKDVLALLGFGPTRSGVCAVNTGFVFSAFSKPAPCPPHPLAIVTLLGHSGDKLRTPEACFVR